MPKLNIGKDNWIITWIQVGYKLLKGTIYKTQRCLSLHVLASKNIKQNDGEMKNMREKIKTRVMFTTVS